MNISLIKSEKQYNDIINQYKKLFRKRDRSDAESEKMVLLGLLIDKWEKEHYSQEFPQSDPIDLIKFLMDQHKMTPKDMEGILGTQSKVSEVLNKRRSLSLSMIRKTSQYFNIPADLLIREYSLAV